MKPFLRPTVERPQIGVKDATNSKLENYKFCRQARVLLYTVHSGASLEKSPDSCVCVLLLPTSSASLASRPPPLPSVQGTPRLVFASLNNVDLVTPAPPPTPSRPPRFSLYRKDNWISFNEQEIVSDMPASLRADVVTYVQRNTISQVPFFAGKNAVFVADVVVQLKPRLFRVSLELARAGLPRDDCIGLCAPVFFLLVASVSSAFLGEGGGTFGFLLSNYFVFIFLSGL